MGLDSVFTEKQERVDEKKLESITTEEAAVDDILSRYTKYYRYSGVSLDDIFHCLVGHFKDFRITPSIITKVHQRLPAHNVGTSSHTLYNCYKGAFLSALIQASYNQGFNNFEFGEIGADYFGLCLKGKKDSPISIKAKIISSGGALSSAEHCYLEADSVNADLVLWKAKSCGTKIKRLDGTANIHWPFIIATGCKVEILDYDGKEFLMYKIKDCVFYSTSPKLLQKLESSVREGENNRFVLGRIPF